MQQLTGRKGWTMCLQPLSIAQMGIAATLGMGFPTADNGVGAVPPAGMHRELLVAFEGK